jgi:hypothetical protein
MEFSAGFHLTGRVFEGWRATHEIARALPDAFVPNSVGTTFLI